MGGYYQKFYPKFGQKARVLHQLTKHQLKRLEGAQQAFNELKKTMSLTPILTLPNFDEEFVIETVTVLERCFLKMAGQ